MSETNFKFFIQFVSYGSVYCSFVLVFMAIFVAEVKAEVSALTIPLVSPRPITLDPTEASCKATVTCTRKSQVFCVCHLQGSYLEAYVDVLLATT